MQTKRIVVLLAVFLLVLLSVACSDKSSKTADNHAASNTVNPTSSTPSATVIEKPYDISYMSFAYVVFPPAQGPAVDAIKEKFNANIKAQYILAADYPSKLSVVMASGNIPDVTVIQGPPDSSYYKWARQGAFLPLDQYLEKYESFKTIPTAIYNSIKVDGHVYSIPTYTPSYQFTGLIRQDWLNKLGLKMPTNYEELLKVAIAFTKNDPDGNNKDDTYGFALSQNISPDYSFGAYWSAGWYHKNKSGQYIPGLIGPGRKEIIQMLSDAYAQGAVTRDFAVMDWGQTNKEFYSGKAGIFIGIPNGMDQNNYLGLLQLDPKAKLASIPYFISPDGRQGGLSGRGYFALDTLSSSLKNDPGKIKKILEIMDNGQQWIPVSERNPQNKQYDWLFGHVGVGYDMVNGLPVLKKGAESVTPIQYMLQRHEAWRPWAPNDNANQFSKTAYSDPRMQEMIGGIEEMESKYNKNPYYDPSYSAYSETNAQKGTELTKYLNGEQTKMIAGARPVADWDKMVKEWMDRGGDKIIQETNDGIKASK